MNKNEFMNELSAVTYEVEKFINEASILGDDKIHLKGILARLRHEAGVAWAYAHPNERD